MSILTSWTVQLESFRKFSQWNIQPEERADEGLQENIP